MCRNEGAARDLIQESGFKRSVIERASDLTEEDYPSEYEALQLELDIVFDER